MDKILDFLEKYKELTEKIIKDIEQDKLSNIEKSFSDRQVLIDKIKGLDVKAYKNQFEQNITPLEEKLRNLMEVKKNDAKEELIKIKKERQARTAYSTYSLNINFLNKKI